MSQCMWWMARGRRFSKHAAGRARFRRPILPCRQAGPCCCGSRNCVGYIAGKEYWPELKKKIAKKKAKLKAAREARAARKAAKKAASTKKAARA